MIRIQTCRWSRSILGYLILFIFLMAGCTKEIQLTIVQPAEVNTNDLQKVAVGKFDLARVHYVSKLERNGKWQRQAITLTEKQKQSLANQIRGRVISTLATVPYFDLVYTDEFAALENDAALQDAIAAGGFRTSTADAVINGSVWLDIVKTDGVDIGKSDLRYMQGGREGSFNYDLEVLVFWPYKSINGNMALELKLTRLNPTEVVAVTFDSRSYSHMIGGKPADLKTNIQTQGQALSRARALEKSGKDDSGAIEESDLVLPSFEELVSNLAESIATQFIRKISISRKTVSYEIAAGGNKTATLLIEAGAYEKAITVLTATLNQAAEKNPSDLYNLGLCFEAIGDYGLASVSYADALRQHPDNLLYARGIGRIDRLKRENRRLRQQLSSK